MGAMKTTWEDMYQIFKIFYQKYGKGKNYFLGNSM